MITLKEGLLNKKNINTIDKTIFYLIFPFLGDQQDLEDDFSDCVFHKLWTYFIIPKQRLEDEFGSIEEYLSTLGNETAVWEINKYDREGIINHIKNVSWDDCDDTMYRIDRLKNFKRIK